MPKYCNKFFNENLHRDLDVMLFSDELGRVTHEITDGDFYVLMYLLEKALYDFMVGTYDEDYKIPYLRAD